MAGAIMNKVWDFLGVDTGAEEAAENENDNVYAYNYDKDVVDEVIAISDEEAINTARELMKKEGIMAGISSGANMAAAIMLSKRKENENKNIIVILPDTGERYLSSELFD